MDTSLSGIELPRLSDSQVEELDWTITEEEVRDAILSMKAGKSPGLDGLPVEYYKSILTFLCLCHDGSTMEDWFAQQRAPSSLVESVWS